MSAAGQVRVRVLFFAVIAEQAGCAEDAMDLPASTTAEAVLVQLAQRHPRAAAAIGRSRLAVDHAFVSGAIGLRANAELAVIPPVSGG